MSDAPSPELRAAIRAAAHWYARLRSGAATNAEHQQWARWLDESALHRDAWLQVEQVCAGLPDVPHGVATAALGSGRSRRNVLRAVAAVATTAPLAWLGYRVAPVDHWQADHRTATGERRHLELADGTELTLDSATSLDLDYRADERLLRLHDGRILVTSSTDSNRTRTEPRPLIVETRHGRAEALGTRFAVSVLPAHTRVTVLESAVRIEPGTTPGQTLLLRAGEQATFDRERFRPTGPASPSAASWTSGSIVAVDMPLVDLVAELARYRRGRLSCDPAIAHLAVSGAFPLDDSDRALALIAAAFPVRVSRITAYWVRLVPAS